MKTILITGGCGFIGSNFIKYILIKYPNYKVVNLDLLTYAGDVKKLSEVTKLENYFFVQGDISDRNCVTKIFNTFAIDTVINFAAESHVDKSIESPEIFTRTNILGTQVLLEEARRSWEIKENSSFVSKYKKNTRYLQISTDEVYGNLGSEGLFTEESPISPNSPYSASKAGADLLVKAYYSTYGMPVMITRCSNNYGPYQHPEKLIPLMIWNALENNKMPIYGDGLQIRDWLHVEDHCRAIDVVIHQGEIGEVYNIGGNNEKTNIDIVMMILKKMGRDVSLIDYVKDRLGHDRRYAIDNKKITQTLNWKPIYSFEEGIQSTLNWYIENLEWLKSAINKT